MRSELVDAIIENLGNPDRCNWQVKPTFLKNPFREIHANELPAVSVTIIQGSAERMTTDIEYGFVEKLQVAYVAQGNNDDLINDIYLGMETIEECLINSENDSFSENSLWYKVDDLELTGWALDLQNANVGTGAAVLQFDAIVHRVFTQTLRNLGEIQVDIEHRGESFFGDPGGDHGTEIEFPAAPDDDSDGDSNDPGGDHGTVIDNTQ